MIKSKAQNGQSLVESLIVLSVLFLAAYGVIEVMRLLSFKSELHAITSFLAHKIAYQELDILRKNVNSNVKDEIRNEISNQISNQLNSLKSSQISFDNKKTKQNEVLFVKKQILGIHLEFAHARDSKIPPGVYLKVNACLPVLFSSYYQLFSQNRKNFIGKKVATEEGNKNCLGFYSNNEFEPVFWFKVRSAAYAPWPESTEIFQHGLDVPEDIAGLDTKNKNYVREKIKTMDLSSYLFQVGMHE